MRYESRPFVKRIKQFSSFNGSDSFHLKWSFGKLSNTPVRSKAFEAGMVKLSSDMSFDNAWQFEIIRTETEDIVRLTSTKEEYMIDIYMARIMLRNETTGCQRFGSSILFSRNSVPLVWKLPINELSNRTDDKYALHCFLDIPNDVYMSIGEGRIQKYGQGLLSRGIADIFDEISNQTCESESSTSDVVLITKQNDIERRFYCHRIILCTRSSVFKTMLGNKKFVEARDRVVQIDDIDTETMLAFLEYAYTSYIQITLKKDVVAKLMNAAEKYDLPELIEQCGTLFMHTYREDIDRLDLLQCAELYRLDWVKRICLMALSTNIGVLDDEDFREGMADGLMDEVKVRALKRFECTKVIEIKSLND